MNAEHWIFKLGLALLAGPLAIPCATAQLSAPEQRIVEAVQSRRAAAFALLEEAVNINSGTLNAEGVRAVGRHYRRQFDELGFETRWIDMPPEMQRGGHLVAVRKGGQGKRLLLLGHMDTVFEKDSPVAPWKVEAGGKRIRGQGVSDMKGGNTILIEALRALHATGALDNTRIAVMLTGDEERTGAPLAKAREDMIALARQSDVALSFEGMLRLVDGSEQVATARRASGGWKLEVKARQGHSSGVFGPVAGYGAAYELARILNAFREQLIEPNLTFSPGVLLAGTEVAFDDEQSKGSASGKSNVIPPAAVARGDLRYLTAEQGARVRDRMSNIVAASLPATSASITFRETYPPMAPTAGNERLARMYSEASEAAGLGKLEISDPGTRGAGDVQFVAPLVDCLDGLGAAGGGAHGPNEYLYADSIERNAIRAALMIYRLTR